jgi:putative nucleotidyltransferase with HDIG domain
MSVSSAVDYAGILILGPALTAWIEAASVLVLQVILQRRPLKKAVFNMAAFALNVLVAGEVYAAFGGVTGHLTFPGSVVPLLAMGVSYFLVNTVLVSLVIGLAEGKSPWRVWEANYLWTIVHLLAFLPLGALIALAYVDVGIWGVLLFVAPLLVARYSFQMYMEIRRDVKDFVRALAGVIDEVDPYTRKHSIRVATYAVAIAREMGLPERQVEDIECGALLHDIGKVGTDRAGILRKPARLTPEERERMSEHVRAGVEIVGKIRALRKAAEIVGTHHERLDGNGYPRGMAGREIPLGTKIVQIADALDAMTSDRPYRPAMPIANAFAELRRYAGTQFDADVLAVLERLFESGRLAVNDEEYPSGAGEGSVSAAVGADWVPQAALSRR